MNFGSESGTANLQLVQSKHAPVTASAQGKAGTLTAQLDGGLSSCRPMPSTALRCSWRRTPYAIHRRVNRHRAGRDPDRRDGGEGWLTTAAPAQT